MFQLSIILNLFSDQQQNPPVDQVLAGLQVDLLMPYSQVQLTSQAELPDSCLSFGMKSGQSRWFIFSEAEEVRRTRTELCALLQVRQPHLESGIRNN